MNKLIYILLLCLFYSCKKKEIGPQCPTCHDEVIVNTSEVIISCEGNFGWGNASLSLYDPIGESINNSVFSTVNGYQLGDIAQSLQEINGDLYVVVNNSGKIEILDTATYQVTSTIQGLTSPRYIEQVSSQKAYISDLYSNQISILNLSTNQISGGISTGRWTEKIQLVNDQAFVTSPDTNFVFVIDVITDQIVDTLILSAGPSGIVLDKNNQLWILCDGGYNLEIPRLYQIDPITHLITRSFAFSNITESPGKLSINTSKDQIFYLNGGVYNLSIASTLLPQVPIIDNTNKIFYGLAIDPKNSEIYVADPIDYVQSGIIYRYDSTGISLDQFTVGIIPQAFWFK